MRVETSEILKGRNRHALEGSFFPDTHRVIHAVARIDTMVENLFELYDVDLKGVKIRFVRAARMDFANYLLAQGYGYAMAIESFNDLDMAELEYIEGHIDDIADGGRSLLEEIMHRRGWLPRVSPIRVQEYIQRNVDLSSRVRDRLNERYRICI